MLAVVDIVTIALAVILSSVMVVILLYTGLHRTILCGIGGIGVTAMVWRSFPPAATLPPLVEVIFCLLVSLAIYRWPEQLGFPHSPRFPVTDDDVLDRFFEE